MIERIVEEDLGLGLHIGHVVADQRRQRIAHRPKHALQHIGVAPQLVQLPHLVLVRRVQHLVFDAVDHFAGGLDRREIAVDDGVDQRIGEIVGAACAQPVGHRAFDALAHGIERIAFALLEGDDEVLAEEDGDLLVAVRRDIVDHPDDDEGMILEEIHLRPLAGVDDIFQRQRMQAENAADLLDQRDVGKAGAVQPD